MAAFDPRVARALAAPARADILRHLEDSGQAQTVEEIAAVVGLHVNTVRSHLDVLADVGLVSRDGERRRGPGRPRVLYVTRAVQPEPAAEPDADQSSVEYRSLAEALADELALALPDPSGAAVQAGRRWAEELDRAGWVPDPRADSSDDIACVVALLERLGFAPETEPLGDRIYLRHCPFENAMVRNQRVLCDIHLGLIRGAFAQLGGRVEVTDCNARVRDQLCVVHLSHATRAAADGEPGRAAPRRDLIHADAGGPVREEALERVP